MPIRSDRFHSYAALKAAEREGTDYHITVRPENPAIAVMAPHGGGIEPGTSELARAVADGKFTCYCFDGVKPRGNGSLHLTSTRFDEPLGMGVATGAHTVVTLHGCEGGEEYVLVGGGNALLGDRIRTALPEVGIAVRQGSRLAGRSPLNLCNRCGNCGGVQLELSCGLRAGMFKDLAPEGRKITTAVFETFVCRLRDLLTDYEKEIEKEAVRLAPGKESLRDFTALSAD